MTLASYLVIYLLQLRQLLLARDGVVIQFNGNDLVEKLLYLIQQ
jgi:hypothetical protein